MKICSLILTLLLFVLSGCKKDKESQPYAMKATIKGSAFIASEVVVAYQSGTLIIIGKTANEEIEMLLTHNGTGTYSITSGWPSDHLASYQRDYSSYVAVSGKVVLSATSPNLVGTFNLTLDDCSKVTNGTFTAKGL